MRLGRRRNRKKRRRTLREHLHPRAIRWSVGLVAVVVLGSLGGQLVWRAMRSRPHFALREITVEGADRIPAEKIRELARVSVGTNTWDVDLEAVRRRVQHHPWVRRARVRRSLPDRVIVAVREHHDVAAVVSGNVAYAVDRRGRIITALRSQPTDVPLIRGIAPRDLATGNPRVGNQLRSAAALIRILSRFHPVTELEIDAAAGVTVRSTQLPGVPIAFGWGDWKHKRHRLDAVLALWAARRDEIRSVSVEFDNDVVVQVQGAAAALPAA